MEIIVVSMLTGRVGLAYSVGSAHRLTCTRPRRRAGLRHVSPRAGATYHRCAEW